MIINLNCKLKCYTPRPCGGLNKNGPPPMFEYLISTWNCLGRISRCGLVGRGVLPGAGFKVVMPSCLCVHSRRAYDVWIINLVEPGTVAHALSAPH